MSPPRSRTWTPSKPTARGSPLRSGLCGKPGREGRRCSLPFAHQAGPAAVIPRQMGRETLSGPMIEEPVVKLKLTILSGPHQGKEFVFDGHDTFLVEMNPPRC